MAERSGPPILEVRGLNVFYGASHALQGVDLVLPSGVLSVVGRNGMGKTTLCKAIMGLVPAASGSIRLNGRELVGMQPADIARLGIGYVPQGRRLWRSLTVDEHLRLIGGKAKGAWTVERIYATFPRLAERRNNGGGQLSGGEQQMLAISRALLLNPRLLVMDEPTEGLAPVIVNQVAEMLVRLGEEGSVDVLVIEQNIGVATTVAERVAIMVNGRINRETEAAKLANDRELQQRMLGVGRHGEEKAADTAPVSEAATAVQTGPRKIYLSNPSQPTRWSQPVPVRVLEQSARIVSSAALVPADTVGELRPLSAGGEPVVLVAGTLDTKGEELRFIRDILRGEGLPVRLVDLSTSGRHSGADVPAHQVAAFHPRGASGVFSSDRGEAVAGMTLAFERWMRARGGVMGVISAGGSGGTALATPAMRALPIGVPKIMISTVAASDTRAYLGGSDIVMMPAVADVQGLNGITRMILANGAHALAGMVKARAAETKTRKPADARPTVALTMFGVTTPCIQAVTKALEADHDCLVFHATGTGGRAMENLIDGGQIGAVLDLTTTEVADMLVGGIFPATEDRFGAVIRKRIPFIGSCGALDMVNFGAPDSVPERFRRRLFVQHNPQVTLMRTTAEENAEFGRWIGAKLNSMEAPIRFLLPEGGVSALDRPGQPFHDPAADRALFAALEETVRQTSARRLVRVPHNINDAGFVDAALAAFRELHGSPKRVGARKSG